MKSFPTPTLDKIKQMQEAGTWPAAKGESIDPTSLDDKMRDVLLLASLENIGSMIFEDIQSRKPPKPVTPIIEIVPPKEATPVKETTSTKEVTPTKPVIPAGQNKSKKTKS